MMLELLAVAMLAAHLLAMNLATAGPLIAAWLAWSRPANDSTRRELARRMVRDSMIALIVGVLLGVALAFIVWPEHGPMLRAAFDLLPLRRYWFGGVEILFSLACLLWQQRMSRAVEPSVESPDGRRWWRGVLPLAAGTNLAYHFPPLFAMLGVYSTRPASWQRPLSFVEALADAEVAGHWIHFLLAAATTGGLWLAWLAIRAEAPQGDRQRWTLRGGRVALAGTVLQLASGLQLLSVIPEPSRAALLGGKVLASLALAAAIVASVSLLHRLAGIALAESTPREIIWALATLAAIVTAMVAGLQSSRRAIYETVPRPNETNVPVGATSGAPVGPS